LILKPSSLGDVVQALPVLRMLKRHWPDAEVSWWLDSNLLGLLEGDPDLKTIYPFERRRWAQPSHWPALWRLIRALRSERFELVIDLQGLARSGVFAWLSNGAFTLGVDDPREGARGFYDIAVPRGSFETHAVDWYLRCLAPLEVPVDWRFAWLPPRAQVRDAFRRRWRLGGQRRVVLNPGARWPNKRWPIEHFVALARRLVAHDADLQLLILGAAEDQPSGQAIAAVDPQRCLNLTGQTTLGEMVECIRMADLMITNDTGPMHVAAALGKPVIALFGPTHPSRTGPYRQTEHVLQRSDLPCVPCLRPSCNYVRPIDCLRGITPEVVFECVTKRLASIPPARDF
jgi:lipopolysaccharide heptosyltransferase I